LSNTTVELPREGWRGSNRTIRSSQNLCRRGNLGKRVGDEFNFVSTKKVGLGEKTRGAEKEWGKRKLTGSVTPHRR